MISDNAVDGQLGAYFVCDTVNILTQQEVHRKHNVVQRVARDANLVMMMQ